MEELRDIKPLVPLSTPLPTWFWALVGLALLAALLVAWRRARTKRVPRAVVSDADTARLAIAAIRGARPSDQAAAERLQSHVALVMRRWIEAHSDVQATEMTTEELTAEPRLAAILGDDGRSMLLELLALADAVRFARRAVSPDEHAASVERAWTLVNRRTA